MKLFYEDLLIGEVVTNHSMSIEDIFELLGIDMDMIAEENGWDDWDYEKLRVEV